MGSLGAVEVELTAKEIQWLNLESGTLAS